MKSTVKWDLFLLISRNPTIETKELVKRGYKAQTVRRYRKAYYNAEKQLMGLK